MESLNKIILTYIRSVKYVEEPELGEKIAFVAQKLDLEPPNVTKVIESLNKPLQNHGFKVVKSVNEISSAMTYVFVNLNHNHDIDKQLAVFKDSEIYIIQLIIDEIFNHNYHIPPSILTNQLLSTINHSTNNIIANKSSRDISALIGRLIALGYLQLVNNAYLIMSIRLVSELKAYLTNRFEVISCGVCKEIVTRGVFAGELGFHYKCYDIYVRSSGEGGEIRKIGIEI